MDKNKLEIAAIQGFLDFVKQNAKDFDAGSGNKLIYTGDKESLNSILKTFGVTTSESLEGTQVLFGTLTPGFKPVFARWIDQTITPENAKESFFVLDTSGNYVFIEGGRLAEAFGDPGFENEVINKLIYYRIYSALARDNFSDHHNRANEEFVLYSSAKGVIRIQYSTAAPSIKNSRFPEQSTDNLIELLNDTQYKAYFVNAVFTLFKGEPTVSLTDISNSSDSLVKMINRDYELVLKQFDFDKFKDSLLKEKEKYFTSIRQILSTVYGQLIGIPLSISASVFATYKVNDDWVTLLLVGVGFLFYVLIYIKIQLDYRRDLIDLRTDFERDFEVIKTRSGLPRDMITEERNKVLKRISRVIRTIYLLIGIIVVLACTFFTFLTIQLLKTIADLYLFHWALS